MISGRPAPDERILDWLDDLAGFGADAAYLVDLGKDAYLADTAQGRLLRNAGERLLIKVATIVERLPDAFKAEYGLGPSGRESLPPAQGRIGVRCSKRKRQVSPFLIQVAAQSSTSVAVRSR